MSDASSNLDVYLDCVRSPTIVAQRALRIGRWRGQLHESSFVAFFQTKARKQKQTIQHVQTAHIVSLRESASKEIDGSNWKAQ